MIVEQVIIGFIVGVALFEIYYGWKLRQEREIIKTLKRAWETSHMYTFDEEKRGGRRLEK